MKRPQTINLILEELANEYPQIEEYMENLEFELAKSNFGRGVSESAYMNCSEEREKLKETLFILAERLGIDYEEARKSPGKPSDVYWKYINRLITNKLLSLTEDLKGHIPEYSVNIGIISKRHIDS
ncbi:hypothetical protein M316_0140 [Nitrincola phage 1M3-16]|uniref:hypothetical protein n=1 Tax=Nitrincola phage 1M3-16 TaxID=1472912 RepID=UPI000444C55F|nr:hypothetical protein GJ22_gp012 [Nitrincola phage 1M3-16]AHX01205.1 hypothetical protein M316_0140 [Nitrincola phage 1M3-16]